MCLVVFDFGFGWFFYRGGVVLFFFLFPRQLRFIYKSKILATRRLQVTYSYNMNDKSILTNKLKPLQIHYCWSLSLFIGTVLIVAVHKENKYTLFLNIPLFCTLLETGWKRRYCDFSSYFFQKLEDDSFVGIFSSRTPRKRPPQSFRFGHTLASKLRNHNIT